jgi:hypothetical protein
MHAEPCECALRLMQEPRYPYVAFFGQASPNWSEQAMDCCPPGTVQMN